MRMVMRRRHHAAERGVAFSLPLMRCCSTLRCVALLGSAIAHLSASWDSESLIDIKSPGPTARLSV